jgi:hypothetical protein
MTWTAAVLGTVAVAGMMGCNPGQGSGKAKGAASVSVNALSIDDVSSMTVSVQGGGMLSPLVVPLVKKGNQFSALVSDLPVGTDYAFTASAKNGATPPVELYHGGVTGQSIIKNQTANIVINMNQVAPAQPLSNSAPVIDSLTATSLNVSNNDTVTISATAHDPDAGETVGMGWTWTSLCANTLSNVQTVAGNDTQHGASTVTFTAPATDGACQVTLTVTDVHGLLKNMASLTIQVNASTGKGNAKITALPNTCPVIGDFKANPVPLTKGVATTLTVDATDADGDTLNYHWTVSSNCSSGLFGAATASTTPFTLDSGSSATSCSFSVVVDDGLFPNNDPKCILTNTLTLPVFDPTNNVAAGAPVFGYDYQSEDLVSGNDTVTMEIVCTDGCPGGTISLDWSDDDGQPLLQIATPAAPFTSGVTYNAPLGFESEPKPTTVTVTATCSLPNTVPATHLFKLVPANSVCGSNPEGYDCTATARLSNKCILAATCVSGTCTPTSTGMVSCPQNVTGVNQCNANACVPTSGDCVVGPVSDLTPCDDGSKCTTGQDICVNGSCTYSTGNLTTCTQPSNVCLEAACNPGTGNCDQSNHDGVSCNDGFACTTGDICTGGTCGGTAVKCNSGYVCEEPQGDCIQKVCIQPNYASAWVPPFVGLALGTDGTPWATGQIYNPFDFGTGTPVTSTGSADIYLAKLNPTNGKATAAFTFGDTGKNDQTASGVAVAPNANVGVIGTFSGEIDFTAKTAKHGKGSFDFLTAAGSSQFWGVFSGASTGTYVTPIFENTADLGSGSLLSIASSTSSSQQFFAICGKSGKLVDDGDTADGGMLTDGSAVYGGGMDIVVAKIDATTGKVVWGKQFGGAGDQVCQSVAIDSNGDVIIAGNYNGTLQFGALTAFPVLDSTRALIYVARLKAADGTPLVAKAWGTSGRSDAVGLTVDANNNIVVAGSMAGNIDFGNNAGSTDVSITNAGLTDAYAAKLTTNLVPVWAQVFGDSGFDQGAKTVSVASSGDVYIAGAFEGTLTGLGLTAASNTAPDAFIAQLASADGSMLCAHKYGDAAGAQGVSSLAVARTASAPLTNAIFLGGGFSGDMVIGSADLNTGSAGLSWSYVARMTP